MKDYKEMSMEEIEEIRRRGGDDLNKLNQAVADYLDDLDLSGEALEVIADTPINSMADAFGGMFAAEEVEKACKMSLDEFIDYVLSDDMNNIENDYNQLWVNVKGYQYTIDVTDVLDHEEKEAFEATNALIADRDHEAWSDLYELYLENDGIERD